VLNGKDDDKSQVTQWTVLCPECQVLLKAFIDAVHEIISLSEMHILAVVENESEPHRFEILLHAANEKKLNAKYAYIAHWETHRSSSIDETDRSGT
jgi:hypothetical protein